MNETMSSRKVYPDNLAGDLAGVRKSAVREIKEIRAQAKTNTSQSFANRTTANADSDEWKDFDFSAVNPGRSRSARALSRGELWRLVIAGIISGALVWLVRLALEYWFMRPLFCRTPDTATVCTNAAATSFVVALVIVGAIAASILATHRVFRATLISVATFVALGALWPLLDNHTWFIATILAVLFTTGLYLFFGLVAAVKKYVLAVLAMAILVLLFWWLARG